MIDLTGYRVLVTGGSRGIGAACCRALAGVGAKVGIHFRERREDAEEVLSSLPGAGHLLLAADLGDPAAIDSLFDRVRAEWNGLDSLVNNAGVWVRNPLAELDGALLRETLEVNLVSVFHCTARALPLLAGSPCASIVNIASTAGQRGEAFYSPYAATKGALIAATRSWGAELAPDVRVNAVAPGWVDTEMCAEPFAGGGQLRIEAGIPLRRVASPEDIAGPVLFLVSELSRHLTGSVVSVNGGGVMSS